MVNLKQLLKVSLIIALAILLFSSIPMSVLAVGSLSVNPISDNESKGDLKIDKLHVKYLSNTSLSSLTSPRYYTLTHSDFTGELFLSIGPYYDAEQTSKFYTRIMRDEVLAELKRESGGMLFNVYCHVSGGFVIGSAALRYQIFKSELPLALKAFRYGDKTLFNLNPELDQTPIIIHFSSSNVEFNKTENWGKISDYKI